MINHRSLLADGQTFPTPYPSIRKPVDFSTLAIAAARSSRTTSLLTSPPFDIVSWSSLPFGDPEATSARNKSPVDKWENLYLATILSHCVPFPQPGPPRTQMIGTFESMTWKNRCKLISINLITNQQKAHQVWFSLSVVCFDLTLIASLLYPIMQSEFYVVLMVLTTSKLTDDCLDALLAFSFSFFSCCWAIWWHINNSNMEWKERMDNLNFDSKSLAPRELFSANVSSQVLPFFYEDQLDEASCNCSVCTCSFCIDTWRNCSPLILFKLLEIFDKQTNNLLLAMKLVQCLLRVDAWEKPKIWITFREANWFLKFRSIFNAHEKPCNHLDTLWSKIFHNWLIINGSGDGFCLLKWFYCSWKMILNLFLALEEALLTLQVDIHDRKLFLPKTNLRFISLVIDTMLIRWRSQSQENITKMVLFLKRISYRRCFH